MTTPTMDRVMSPANLIVPIKSWLEVKELTAVVHFKARQAARDSDTVGTLHFDRWVDLHDHNQVAFFSAFDGDFSKYIQDFAKYIGPFFDALFKHVLNAPPNAECSKRSVPVSSRSYLRLWPWRRWPVHSLPPLWPDQCLLSKP